MTNHPARRRGASDAATARLTADLDRVAHIVREGRQVQQALLERTVLRGRLEGRSWTDIGRDLGVSRQAARQRWKHVEKIPGDVQVRVMPDGETRFWSEALDDWLYVEDQVVALGVRRLHELADSLAAAS